VRVVDRAGKGAAYDGSDGVAGGEGEHVGAGDDAGALVLEKRLDAVQEGEPTQRQVGRRVLLRLGAVGPVQQHRCVAALHADRSEFRIQNMPTLTPPAITAGADKLGAPCAAWKPESEAYVP
jgi:hypothetical protein